MVINSKQRQISIFKGVSLKCCIFKLHERSLIAYILQSVHFLLRILVPVKIYHLHFKKNSNSGTVFLPHFNIYNQRTIRHV